MDTADAHVVPLAAWLRQNRDRILAAWEGQTRTELEKDGLSARELRDHLPELLQHEAGHGAQRQDRDPCCPAETGKPCPDCERDRQSRDRRLQMQRLVDGGGASRGRTHKPMPFMRRKKAHQHSGSGEPKRIDQHCDGDADQKHAEEGPSEPLQAGAAGGRGWLRFHDHAALSESTAPKRRSRTANWRSAAMSASRSKSGHSVSRNSNSA